jgi:hypothetical protein
MSKPRKRPGRSVRKPKRRATVAGATAPILPRAKIRAALDACAAAQRLSASRGMELLAVADHLGKAAVTDFRDSLCNTLFAARILDDMLALSAYFNAPTEGLPEDLRPFQLLPTAFLQWVEQHLDLRPYLQVAEELEIPASDLSRFDAGDAHPKNDSPLIRVRVTRPGWRRGRELFVRPSVNILTREG